MASELEYVFEGRMDKFFGYFGKSLGKMYGYDVYISSKVGSNFQDTYNNYDILRIVNEADEKGEAHKLLERGVISGNTYNEIWISAYKDKKEVYIYMESC